MSTSIHNNIWMEVCCNCSGRNYNVSRLRCKITYQHHYPSKRFHSNWNTMTPNATCTIVVWTECWPPRHHIMIIASILIVVIWINHFQSPYPFITYTLYGSELVLYWYTNYDDETTYSELKETLSRANTAFH